MTLRVFLPLVSLPLLATAAPALAQEALEPAMTPVVFPTMGPDATTSQLGGAFTLLTADGDSDTLKRLDLMAQYIGPSGLGGYATLAASFAEDASHLGSLEVGGVMKRRSGDVDIGFRAGLILPTSGDGDDFEDGPLVHVITSVFSRPSDLLAAAADTTTLRLAVTPSFRSGHFVARADVGLDVVLATEGDGDGDAYLHLDAGAGFHNGKLGALVELSNLFYLEEADQPIHLVALTGELTTGKFTPYLTISRPFGDAFFEDVEVTNFVLGARGSL
jgi:hypothetical protein